MGLTGTHAEPADPMVARPEPAAGMAPLGMLVLGGLVLAGSLLTLGPHGVAVGAVVFALAAWLAVVETSWSLVRWPVALIVLVSVVWLIPIRLYRFPFEIGFALEPYRVVVGLLACALLVWGVRHRGEIAFGGMERPLVVLVGVAILTQIVNYHALSEAEPGGALKSLSYFLSFVVVFVVVSSVVKTLQDAENMIKALVLGALGVALFAAYEARTGYNVFSHLQEWIPVLERDLREQSSLRGGRQRVRASAQHPIALAAALMMMVPFAIYLASRARSRSGIAVWAGASVVIALGALTTISRTAVLMGIAMAAAALWLRPRVVVRFWPLLIVLPIATHVVAPGVLGGLYNSLFPRQGLVTQLSGREGLSGSGRFDDIDPAFALWQEAPFVGHGIGTSVTTENDPERVAAPIIFDNQYLLTLVQTGAVGLLALVWFVVSASRKLVRGARARAPDGTTDLLAACCVSVIGFGAGMLAFDALAFVQATLIFFMIAAVGLSLCRTTRAKQLAPAAPVVAPS